MYCSTLKPLGAMGHAFCGCGIMLGPLSTDSFSFGEGRSLHREVAASAGRFMGCISERGLSGEDISRPCAFDCDCAVLRSAECLAAEAPMETRQKIVQIRIWLLRKRYMTPRGDLFRKGEIARRIYS